jgi:phenylalanyl-tRNA synthetase alpha subunit
LYDSATYGHRHALSMTMEKAVDIFTRLGYDTVTECAESPEIESDYYCFEALNCPKDHPARDMQDTFYLTSDLETLLRTHTSAVQIRQLSKRKPPLRIVAPGRVYRRDDIDATHSLMFHQVEILALEEKGSLDLGHLKGTVEYFLREMFGPGIKVRFRGSYFPFTEPSMEVDVFFRGRWLEVLGCGMVDPAVLEMAGIDPEKYSGFAAGFGVERFAMVIHDIKDLREFVKSDLRFVEQFPHYHDDGLDTFLQGGNEAKPVEEEDLRTEEIPPFIVTSRDQLLALKEKSLHGSAVEQSPVAGNEESPNGVKGETKTKTTASPGAIDISMLDIRVGVITKAWEHEEADKLFCEEIDIGEEEPRKIASGLRAHYKADDLAGQRVLVLANLKERKLVGFPSHGMVLCASNSEGVVEFVEPPADAKIGERIMVEGFHGEPATENQVIKKKMLEVIFPDVKTDGQGVVTYKGTPFTTSAGACKAQNGMPNANVS